MTKPDNHGKKILFATLLGSGLAIGIIALMKKNKKSSIGNALTQFGHSLEHYAMEKPEVLMKKVENQIHKNGKTITAVLEWVGAGIHLWKKLKNKRGS